MNVLRRAFVAGCAALLLAVPGAAAAQTAARAASPACAAFPAPPARTVAAFQELASLLKSDDGPGRPLAGSFRALEPFAALDFSRPGAASVLGSLSLPEETVAAVETAVESAGAGAPAAREKLEAVATELARARKAGYAGADERADAAAELWAYGSPEEVGESAETLRALAAFYGRGLQLSSIRFKIAARRAEERRAAAEARGGAAAERFPAAAARTIEAFRRLADALGADGRPALLEGRPRLQSVAALDLGDEDSHRVLGALSLPDGAVAQAEALGGLPSGAAVDASRLDALEKSLSEARRASYADADARGAELARDGGAEAERTLRALSSFYGRGLQLSYIQLAGRPYRLAALERRMRERASGVLGKPEADAPAVSREAAAPPPSPGKNPAEPGRVRRSRRVELVLAAALLALLAAALVLGASGWAEALVS